MCETAVSTKMGPPQSVEGYCKLVMWEPPAQSDDVEDITGYDVKIFESGTEISTTVRRTVGETFYVVPKNERADNKRVQVRSVLRSGFGVWSESVELCGCPCASVCGQVPTESPSTSLTTTEIPLTTTASTAGSTLALDTPVTTATAAPCDSDLDFDSSANEFFLGFTTNVNGGLSVIPQLFVSTPESEPVNFTVSVATGFSFNGVATNGTSTVVILPHTVQVDDSSERNKGIHVKAEEGRRINVNGLSYRLTGNADGFLALPCTDLGLDEYQYYGISYPQRRFLHYHSHILIVACEDNTVVTTQSAFFTLNRLETYLIDTVDDLTGTNIRTTRPVSFFSNHECSNVPNNIGGCDHLTEQLPPTVTWGTFFLAASLLGRSSGEIFRMVAAHNSTTVTVNCSTFSQPNVSHMQAPGDWVEFELPPNNYCSVNSTSPLLVAQFALGYGADGVTGDPFMMMIVPVDQYSNNYVVDAPSNFTTNHITLYVTPDHYQPEKIFVDDADQTSSEWTPVYCSEDEACGYITRVNLTHGAHQIYHQNANANLGLSFYGFQSYGSYGYPGHGSQVELMQSTIND